MGRPIGGERGVSYRYGWALGCYREGSLKILQVFFSFSNFFLPIISTMGNIARTFCGLNRQWGPNTFMI